MRLCLCLGCWGASPEGFTLCSGCENEILDLSAKSERNLAIADHLDTHYKLFDHPLNNNVHTAVFSIQEKFSKRGSPVFSRDRFALMERFCVMHSRCGLFLRLRMKEEEDEENR